MTDSTAEKPIVVGDLVQIVRPGCCDDAIGITFVVDSLGPPGPRTKCVRCDAQHGPAPFAYSKDHDGYVATHRLKRIPPLDELESLDYGHKLDVRQPA